MYGISTYTCTINLSPFIVGKNFPYMNGASGNELGISAEAIRSQYISDISGT